MEIKLEKGGHKAILKSSMYREDYWVSLATWMKSNDYTFEMKTETFNRKIDGETFVRKISNLLQNKGNQIVNKF